MLKIVKAHHNAETILTFRTEILMSTTPYSKICKQKLVKQYLLDIEFIKHL